MKIIRKPKYTLEDLKQQYTLQQLKSVRYCLSEIRGLRKTMFGHDDDEIDAEMGEYLAETYDAYKADAVKKGLLSPREFDMIFDVISEVEGPLGF